MAQGTVEVLGLRPFIPSGPNFALACEFFLDLGFEKLWESGDCAGFGNGSAKFILQAYDNAEFASNLMVRLDVSDLDAWWDSVSKKNLEAKFSGVKLKPPGDFPWGREVNIIDIAGVCWHIGQI